jgi:2-dehydro-3-deoxygluconokinase
MLEFNAAEIGRLSEIATFHTGWGGDTSNFAVAAARLGNSVGIMGRIGSDEFGRSFLNLWAREVIDTSHAIVEPDSFTAIYFISRRQDGGHDFTYYRKDSAASHYAPNDIDPEYVAQARVFHSSGITQAISASSCDAVFRAAEIAKEKGVLFSYDPNLRLKLWSLPRARAVINLSFEIADIVFPSLEDARILTGLEEPGDIVANILKRGPKIVVLKLGSEGCMVGTVGKIFTEPPIKVKAVDSSGAGDAFDAGFITGLLAGWTLKRTARFANAVGALTCLTKGCAGATPTRTQVEEFLANIKED